MIDNLRGVSQQVCYDVMIMVISFRLMKWTRIHKKYSYSMIPSVKKRGNYWLITLSGQTQILLYYYLSQSFHKAPKDIPLSCSHYAVYNLSSGYERNVVSRTNKQKFNIKKQLKTFFICIC